MFEQTFESLCKKEIRARRSLFARIFDTLALYLLVLLVAFLYLRPKIHAPWALWVLLGLTLAIFGVLRHLVCAFRLRRYAAKRRDAFAKNYLLERLVLLPGQKFYKLCAALIDSLDDCTPIRQTEDGLLARNGNERVYLGLLQRHPQAPVQPQQILEFYLHMRDLDATCGVILSTAPYDEACEAFITRGNLPIDLMQPEDLLRLSHALHLLPDSQELDQELIDSMVREQTMRQQKLDQLPKAFLQPQRAPRYALCGVLILLVGYAFGLHVYYAICAAVCFGLSGLTMLLPQIRQAQKQA